MRVGSLFSGIGGIDLGLERAGHETVWQCEIDDKASAVLARHWPSVRRYSDVRRVHAISGERPGLVGGGRRTVAGVGRSLDHPGAIVACPDCLAPVDLVVGGFPCQDLSVAGKRAGLAGERSGLWHEFRRVIAEVTPRWVLIENVPGLLSSWCPVESPPDPVAGASWEVDEVADCGVVIDGLVELGYGVAWRVLDAQYFGVAQRRRRVFVVGCLGDWSAASAVLLEPESVSGDPAPRRTAREDVADGAARSVALRGRDGGGVAELGDDVGTAIRASQGGGDKAHVMVQDVAGAFVPELARTPVSSGGNDKHDPSRMTYVVPDVAWALQERDAKGSDSDTKDGHLIVAATLSSGGHPNSNAPGRRKEDDVNLVAHSLTADGHDASEDGTGRGTPLVALDWTQSGAAAQDDLSPSLRVGSGIGLESSPAIHAPGTSVRRLTPTECERLQGFPDGWTDGQSDSARYRQLGNAVCVPVAAWLGRRLADVSALLLAAA